MLGDLYKNIVRLIPDGIIVLDKSSKVILLNRRGINFLQKGALEEDIIGKEIHAFIEEIPELDQTLRDFVVIGRSKFDLTEVSKGDKSYEIKGRLLKEGLLLTVKDITVQKDAEWEAITSIADVQEFERKRLAKELHDGCGPLVSIIKIQLEEIRAGLSLNESNSAIKLEKVFREIDQLADELRGISHALMPRVLEDFGLIQALFALCTRIKETKSFDVEFTHIGFSSRIESILELALYRSSQELFNNAIKYAEAKKITVQLINRPGESVMLQFEDDGKGFDKELLTSESSGIGIKNIESRILPLGGYVDIDTEIGRGTLITIEIPY